MKERVTAAYWSERPWYIAIVIDAEGFDASVWNMIKLCRTETKELDQLEQMVRDLIATVLDVEPDSFDVRFRNLVSAQVSEAFLRDEIRRIERKKEERISHDRGNDPSLGPLR